MTLDSTKTQLWEQVLFHLWSPGKGSREHRCSVAVLVYPPEIGVGCSLHLRVSLFLLARPGRQGNPVSFSPHIFLDCGFWGWYLVSSRIFPFYPVHLQSEMLPATFSPLITLNLIPFLHGGGNFCYSEESFRSIYVISRRRCQSSSPSFLFSR